MRVAILPSCICESCQFCEKLHWYPVDCWYPRSYPSVYLTWISGSISYANGSTSAHLNSYFCASFNIASGLIPASWAESEKLFLFWSCLGAHVQEIPNRLELLTFPVPLILFSMGPVLFFYFRSCLICSYFPNFLKNTGLFILLVLNKRLNNTQLAWKVIRLNGNVQQK